MKKQLLITVCALSAFAMTSAALAQQPAAAPAPAAAQPQTKPGPVIAGVCVYSNEAVMANAAVSKAAAQRLQQINQQAEAELEPDAAALEKERAGLATQQKTLTKDKFDPLAQAFMGKVKTFQDKAFIVNQELGRTEQEANVKVAQLVAPALSSTYEAKNCGMLVDRKAVLFANPAMDITGDVIAKLDAAKATVDIKRVVLPEADRQKLLKAKAEQDAQQGG
ncbi:OmpH family outer membrane protein [Asticcacaulis sp. AND118]|uniref:OmpH family outer membrane protein n=1 Tax=Asticcacaulis sp. AND118 TaxID=2840468 RepID=UPI001CFF54AA|nr:OmpH family outer membrane protein [Asticcacaulis sp. AND118]UDF02335.1 OmpH family outer membrane protein [Asticcacaulis sp. AND118]